MNDHGPRPRLRVGLAALLVLAALPFFLRAPGTTDVDDWVNWMGRLRGEGVVRGYRTTILDYPPGTPLLLAGTAAAAETVGVSYRVGVKCLLVLATAAFGALYGWWRRSLLAGLGAAGGMLFISVAQQYLDVLALLPLLAAFWALHAERFAAAGALMGVAILMKWQPVIIVPAVGLALLPPRPWRAGPEVRGSVPRILAFVASSAGPVAVGIAIMGVGQVLRSLLHGLRHAELNNQAFNFPWIVQSAIYAAARTDAEALHLCAAVTPGARALFGIVMVCTLARVTLLDGPPAVRAARGALASYLVYFLFATGAPHENHMIQAFVPALALLAIEGRRWLVPCAFIAIGASVNVALYYGFDGTKGLWYNDPWPPLHALAWVVCPLVACGALLIALRALAPDRRRP